MLILSTKLKNEIRKRCGIDYKYALKNIEINGQKRGCSGFIVNPLNGAIIYITTELTGSYLDDRVMIRYAEHLKDYSSHGRFGNNRWFPRKDFQFTNDIIALLSHNPYSG